MLAAATSFFSRTAILQSYNVGPGFPVYGTRSSTPGSPSPLPAATPYTPTFHVGPWRVQPAVHKVTNKRVSVWSFDKKTNDADRSAVTAKDRTIEILKAEASALGRLRHPSILEMVEPLEETRSELIFATEPLLSSLRLSIPSYSRSSRLVELDEVEIQKGILQLCKGLSFLHTSARLIHSNINPETILINSSGDWKMSGLGLTIPIAGNDSLPNGQYSPTHEPYLPAYVQRSLDYMAPEYALDEQLVPSLDMYSLGCLIYATHKKGDPPFKNHNSPVTLRENSNRSPPDTERLDPDLRGLLASLITRHPHNRPTPSTLPSYPFFSSLPISTLNFLDRSTFASKSREEKISFMKGLTSVLERFSEGLRTRKILPSLLEEMKDINLLPYILPNVFVISTSLSPSQFASLVLPNLKPLFAIKEPPQNMITLLDNLKLLQEKTDKAIFREHVLSLVYNALESEHFVVQERALKVVPDLCETIDYAEVQGVLFPRVALVFTKTRILSVKVATLQTFLSMVKTLDQSSLTQKLVPLLSKIRTKEPAVMLSTLAVQEAMGLKVDREAVATLVLPQLWTMSMGPLLNIDQFQRFMSVIRKLGDRVEREHNQHLRDSQRIEDRSGAGLNTSLAGPNLAGSINFESLVAGAAGTVKPDADIENGVSWEDDVWGSILGANVEPLNVRSPPMQSSQPFQFQTHSLPSSPMPQISSMPGQTRRPPPPVTTAQDSTTTHMSSFKAVGLIQADRHPRQPSNPSVAGHLTTTLQPKNSDGFVLPRSALQAPLQTQRPNYNISLSPASPLSSMSSPPRAASPMVLSLSPSAPVQQWTGGSGFSQRPTKVDWGDFDPLA